MRSKSFRRKNRKMSRKRGGQQYRNYVQTQYGTPLNNYTQQNRENFNANSLAERQMLASVPSASQGYDAVYPPPFPANRNLDALERGQPYGGRTRKGRKGKKSRKGGKRRSY